MAERTYEKKLTLPIDDALQGKTVRWILRRYLELSAGLVKQLKETERGICLSGESVRVNRLVQAGECLVLTVTETDSPNISPVPMPLSILYEDEDVLAVNKPGGMPTHPSQNHHTDTLANGVMAYFQERAFTFRAITRLDKDTSGAVLIAKHTLSAYRLSDAMQKNLIQKEYLALVNGIPEPENGVISLPIGRREGSVILRCVSPEGKPAVTEYETVKAGEGTALVRLRPITGRTHQIRVHLSHRGNPIVGDDLYGAPQTEERVHLHCRRLTFPHPETKELITVTAPLPRDML